MDDVSVDIDQFEPTSFDDGAPNNSNLLNLRDQL